MQQSTEKKPEQKPQYHKKYISLIKSETFASEKLSLEFKKGEPFTSFKNVYKYDEKNKDKLMIKTPFFTIKKNSLSNKSIAKNNKLQIDISPLIMDEATINFCIQYDNKIKACIQIFSDGDGVNYACKGRLIQNTNYGVNLPADTNLPMNNIKGIIKQEKYKTGQYSQKWINYNISKKYQRVEQLEMSPLQMDKFNEMYTRAVKEHKQVRFVLSPYTWINHTTKVYESYLIIHTIETKYEYDNIISIMDKSEISIENQVMSIDI